MNTLLLVEDEPLIRAGLKQYFDWTALGIHQIFEAENGSEGVDVAMREHPDLVITDIRMPIMDGLEMIERLRSKLPHSVFIILTGYNDFNYAQRAIRAGGVHEYLLKPLQYEESLATILKCLKVLEGRKEELKARTDYRRMSLENRRYRSSQALKSMLEDDIALNSSTLKTLIDEIEPTSIYVPFMLMNIPKPSRLKRLTTKWRVFVERIVHDLFPGTAGRTLLYTSGSKVFGLAVLTPMEVEEHLSPQSVIRMEGLLRKYEIEADSFFLAALGEATEDLHRVGSTLRTLDRRLFHRFYTTDLLLTASIQTAHTDASRDYSAILEERDKREVLWCLEEGLEAPTQQLMKRMARTVAIGTPERLQVYLQEVIGLTLRFAQKHGIQTEGIFSERLLTMSFVDDFLKLEDLFEWIGEWILHLNGIYIKLNENKPRSTDDRLFEQIESFIYQHINEDISLQVVADRFFYNPSYLSRLFKTKLNRNFVAFLTDIRIKYAQQCLEKPELLVTDVCTLCGYKSYKHFVKMFRMVTRMTPTEYRKQLGL